MFPVFIQPTKQLFLDILDWNAFATIEFNPVANHRRFNLASDSIRPLPFDELVWVGSETQGVVFFLFGGFDE